MMNSFGASGGVDLRQPATRSLRVIAISNRHIRPMPSAVICNALAPLRRSSDANA